MPITSAAKKALKVSKKKHSRNRHFLSLFKESTKALESLLQAEKKDTKKITQTLSEIYSRIDTLEKKNILHKNNAARKKSAYAKMVKSFIQ
ncbi:30S ribosomal protein S20 [Candidatus Gracilibacteria bacterium]|nr:MAG: 30S ribosomal protein S20 [Candidatus Gracilibacteria bacterium]